MNHCYFGPVRFGFIIVWKQQERATNEIGLVFSIFLEQFFQVPFYSVVTCAFGDQAIEIP